jgi:uncharacterized protein
VDLVELVLLVVLTGLFAGLVGSLTGLGGAVVALPVLVIAFGVPFPEAAGAGLLTVLATSSATGAAYVRDGLSDLRIGMFLEIATVPGALVGATVTVFLVHARLDDALLIALGAVLFALVPGTIARGLEPPYSRAAEPDRTARSFGLSGSYYDERRQERLAYAGARTPPALGVAFAAGAVSGMFGIGGGVFKVLALEHFLRLPMKVATATSNFMIGVTGAAGASVLLIAGFINPVLGAPIALGSAAGALGGSRILPRLRNRTVRWLFVPILAVLGVEVILRGLGIG